MAYDLTALRLWNILVNVLKDDKNLKPYCLREIRNQETVKVPAEWTAVMDHFATNLESTLDIESMNKPIGWHSMLNPIQVPKAPTPWQTAP